MKHIIRIISFCTLIGCYAICDESAAWKATTSYLQNTATMHTDSIRCLASLLSTFGQQYRIPLTFEDAPLEAAGDIVDVTVPSYHATNPGIRLFVPRGGPLDFSFSVTPDHKPVEASEAIASLLDVYKLSGYPGVYEIRQSRQVTHVIPVRHASADGRSQPITALMDTRIDLPKDDRRSVSDAVQAILVSVERKRGVRIVQGILLPREYGSSLFPGQIAQTSARDVMQQVMSQVGLHTSWLLLYDPTFRYYVLTIF